MKTCMLFLLFVFLYWGNDIQGQTQEIVLKNYTPSPEAYSLMEYSEIIFIYRSPGYKYSYLYYSCR